MVSGNAIKFGDNVNTDIILPGKYMVIIDPKELAQHAMEGIDSTFTGKVKGGAILVAGKNFGCGSSREQAPLALKHAGVRCVIAESFARIFYRNAINIGLPVIECKDISAKVEDGTKLTVDLKTGMVKNHSKNITLYANKLPLFVLEILLDGGLIENLRKRMKKND